MCDETWIFNWMLRGNTESWTQIEVNSHILSRDPEISRQVEKKSLPPFYKKVVRIHLHLQCHLYFWKWHMSHQGFCQRRRTGSRLVGHLTAPRCTLTDKTQDKSKQDAQLVTHHDMRQRLCANQREPSDSLTCRNVHRWRWFFLCENKSASSPKRQNKHTTWMQKWFHVSALGTHLFILCKLHRNVSFHQQLVVISYCG